MLWNLCAITFIEPKRAKQDNFEDSDPFQVFLLTAKLFIAREMFLGLLCYYCIGMELSFFYQSDSMAAMLITSYCLLIGIGQAIGGIVFGAFGHELKSLSDTKIISIVAAGIQTFVFTIILLHIVQVSIFQYMSIRICMTFFCSLILGFADSCYCTQIYDTLCGLLEKKSEMQVAAVKFLPCLASSIISIYSGIGVRSTAGMIIVCIIMGISCFLIFIFALVTYKINEPLYNGTNKITTPNYC